jgi:hypothetical protein
MNNTMHFVTVLEAESPRSEWQDCWILVRPFFLAADCCLLIISPGKRATVLYGMLFRRTLWFHPDQFPKALTPNSITLELGFLHRNHPTYSVMYSAFLETSDSQK